MKKLFLALTLIISSLSISAQDTTVEADTANLAFWKHNGIASLNFSQTSLSNWSAGGDNAVAANAIFNGNLKYRKGNWLWNTLLGLEYGLTRTKAGGSQKATDKIALNTQLGYSTDNKWFYTLMADFQSQFAKGYNYPNKDEYISKFMAPAYSNVSAGIELRPKGSYYTVYFSPAAGKFTFVNDDFLSERGFFGVNPGDRFRAEFGTFLRATYQKEIMENVKLMTDANFFTAYDNSFGNIDIDWNMLINMKINKYLNANINTSLKYDDDVKAISEDGTKKGPKIQFKEIIGIGIGYNF